MTGPALLVAISLAVLIALTVGVLVLALARLRRPPANSPDVVARRPAARPRVLVAGASTIQGNVSFDIVGELARRFPGYELINGGVNGDTARQVIERGQPMLDCRPFTVILLVGGNDLLAIRQSPVSRRPPGEPPPSIEDYRRDLTELVGLLRGDTGARVALCTLPIAGERLASPVNADVDRMNVVIGEVAASTGATLLPVNARIRELLPSPDGRDFSESVAVMLRSIVLRLGLGLPLTLIARLNGYRVLSDGLHLAPPAGRAAADVMAGFITDVGAG